MSDGFRAASVKRLFELRKKTRAILRSRGNAKPGELLPAQYHGRGALGALCLNRLAVSVHGYADITSSTVLLAIQPA
jgi:hypothetical protein